MARAARAAAPPPGANSVTTPALAQPNTQAYLLSLRAHMKKAMHETTDLSAAVKSFDAARLMRLLNAAVLMPGNACGTDLAMQCEQSPTTRRS